MNNHHKVESKGDVNPLLVLKSCSDINEGNWLQLLFYFNVLMGIVALVIGMSFLSVFQVLG